nr:uncharacterized protein LOC109166346 [Ipomoea batatas]
MLKLQGPKEDILTKALESKEHGGRMRGIGGHVNPSTYFRVGREKGSCNAKGAKSYVKSEEEIEIFKKLDFDDDDDELMFIEKDDALEKQCKKKSDNHGQKLELNSSSMPKSLWLLYCYYKRALDDGDTIKVILDFNVFGETCTLYVNVEDVTPFCQLMPISYTCIGVYIWYLYKKMMDENKLDKFRFVHPYNVGHLPTTKTDAKFLEKQLENRARVIADRLLNTTPNTTVLVPCNIG